MKKTMTLLLLAALTVACTGSTNKAAATAEGDSLVVAIDSIGISMTLKADRPDTAMEQAVAAYLSERLFFIEDEQGRVQRPAYEGDFRQFVQTCARQKWAEMYDQTFGQYPEKVADDEEGISRAEAIETAIQAVREDSAYSSTCLATLRQVYDDGNLVSWQYDYDIYIDRTAHPSQGTVGITLRRQDGRPATLQLRDTRQPAFQQLLKQQVCQWLQTEMEEPEVNDQLLRNYLSSAIKDVNDLPLPQLAPYLVKQGLALCYGEGELIFGVHNSVVLVLPYDEVKPFMKKKSQ